MNVGATGLLLLVATGVAAQRPTARVTAGAGVVRYAAANGPDSARVHGAAAGLAVQLVLDRTRLTLRYTQGALDNQRRATAADVALDVALDRGVGVGVGLVAFADAPAAGPPRRWWAGTARLHATLPIPYTPLTADAALAAGPAGGVNRPGDFTALLAFTAGMRLAVPGRPLAVRLAYDLQRAGTDTRRDAVETVLLGLEWRFR